MLNYTSYQLLEDFFDAVDLIALTEFFETLESIDESSEFIELTEKALSIHSGIQPWDNLNLSNQDMLNYQSGDKETISRINGDIEKVKDKFIYNNKKRFGAILHKVAQSVPNAKVLVDIKSNKSIISKILRKTPLTKMKDILRAAIIVQRQEDIPVIMKEMRRNFNLFQLKTKEKQKDQFGYYGSYHYIVDFNGILCEVQLMTKRLWTYKELGHEVYDKWREKIVKNPNLLTDPKHRDDADNLRKDIAISKKIFNRGNGANVRF